MSGENVGSCCCHLLNSRRTIKEKNWADLHFDLLVLVVRKIDCVQDYFAFRGVCSSWRNVAAYQEDYNCIRLPWLLSTKNNFLEYFNPLAPQDSSPEEAVDEVEETVVEEEIDYCVGCRGWILVVHKKGGGRRRNMHLMHIMSGTRIKLPHLQVRQHIIPRTGIINKMALSSSPLTNPLDFTLMIVYEFGSMMAYWRPGEENFTEIENDLVSDLICHNGLFYSISAERGMIQVIDGSLTKMKVHWGALLSGIMSWSVNLFTDVQTYLVESSGDLLLVLRFGGKFGKWYCQSVESQVYFCVYKIESRDGKLSRISERMESLGNRAIFLGGSSASFSVNACEIPGCKPNHIYFTGHIIDPSVPWRGNEKHHMGVYNLRDGLMEYWGCDKNNGSYCTCSSPPLWVTPTLV